MAKSIPLTLGTEKFATKKAAIERVRQLISTYAVESFLNGVDENLCRELFKYHPSYDEKYGVGIHSIQVRLDEFRNKCLYLHRIDGTDIDISWVKCLNAAN